MKIEIYAILLVVGLLIWVETGRSGETLEPAQLVVQDVISESPAYAAGIEQGDVLLQYNGVAVYSMNDVAELKRLVTSDSVDVVVARNGKRITLRLPAGEMGVYLKEVLDELEYAEDAVVIGGIPKLDWSTGKSNSFLAAVEALANHLGVDRDYVYIYGVSGAAFRLHFYRGWCPSSPDPTCGYNAGEQALHALGLEHHFESVSEGDTLGHSRLRNEMMASIDRGIPVIAIDLIRIPEWGIITGYQAGGQQLLCRTYFDRREGYDVAEKFPWAVCFLDGKKEMPSDADNYKRSFLIALENLTTPEYGEYASGLAAFDTWTESLENEDLSAMDGEKCAMVSTANAWTYERLIDDRMVAAQYLERIAGDFPLLTGKILELAKLYREESELLKPAEEVAVYEFDMKTRHDWSAEMRQEAVLRLRKAEGKEKAALQIWKEIANLTAESKE